MNHLLLAFLIAAAALARSAGAFVGPPTLDPDVAQSGQVVYLHLTTGQCDGVVGGANNPAISINGFAIDVLIDGVRRFDPILCPSPTINHVWPLGTFSSGSYNVTVRYRFTPFGLPTVIETLGVLPLEVLGGPVAQPQPVPAMGLLQLFALILGVMYIGRLFYDKTIAGVAPGISGSALLGRRGRRSAGGASAEAPRPVVHR